jgi:hypothetical protein
MWLYRLQTLAKVMSASAQIITAGISLFYTVRLSIHRDSPTDPYRRNINAPRQIRSYDRYINDKRRD